MSANGSSSSQQLDPAVERLMRETKNLKAKIDLLEAENKALKKSVYELSYVCSSQIGANGLARASPSQIRRMTALLEEVPHSQEGQQQQHHHQHQQSIPSTGASGGSVAQASSSFASSSTSGSKDNTDNNNGTLNSANINNGADGNTGAGHVLLGSEQFSASPFVGSEMGSRGALDLEAQELAKVEEEGVRRMNMESIVSRQDKPSSAEGRQFYLKNDLKGHQGAVYAIQYSPNGKLLASGSFDKTVRIWDGTTNQTELLVMRGHGLNISDLAWGHDSSVLLSAAYDQTCKLWDVESGKLLDSFEAEGFVQCVRFHPQDNRVFFSGTTRNVLSMLDTRKNDHGATSSVMSIRNDVMVNSIYAYHDGLTVISGDSSGYIKTWDIRMGRVLQSILNEPTKKPISHITISKQRGSGIDSSRSGGGSDNNTEGEELESRWLGVNSYDNVIRVYDRGFEPPATLPRLVHTLKGYRNKHWPIKSVFFHGKDYIAGAAARRSGAGRDENGNILHHSPGSSTAAEKDISMESSLILASGSMDPYVFLFDVGSGEGGRAEILQRLSGHTDRVYDVDFHPIDHVLASASADSTIKIWARGSKKKK